MSSADELRAAADRLDELAGAATPGPWSVGSVNPTTNGSWFGNMDPEVPGPVGDAYLTDAAYIATLSPEVGKALAATLRAVAAAWPASEPDHCYGATSYVADRHDRSEGVQS